MNTSTVCSTAQVGQDGGPREAGLKTPALHGRTVGA
jgi:hypothetical protein